MLSAWVWLFPTNKSQTLVNLLIPKPDLRDCHAPPFFCSEPTSPESHASHGIATVGEVGMWTASMPHALCPPPYVIHFAAMTSSYYQMITTILIPLSFISLATPSSQPKPVMSRLKDMERSFTIREGRGSHWNRIPSDLGISIQVKGHCLHLCCSLPKGCGRGQWGGKECGEENKPPLGISNPREIAIVSTQPVPVPFLLWIPAQEIKSRDWNSETTRGKID